MPDTSILMKWPAMQHVPPVCNTSSPILAAATPSHPFAEGWMLWDGELYLCRGTTNICSLVLGNYSSLITVPADSQPCLHPLLFSRGYSGLPCPTLPHQRVPQPHIRAHQVRKFGQISTFSKISFIPDNFISSPVVYDFIS